MTLKCAYLTSYPITFKHIFLLFIIFFRFFNVQRYDQLHEGHLQSGQALKWTITTQATKKFKKDGITSNYIMMEKMYTVVIFLDITSAYDNVNIDNLIMSMNLKGAPRKICWILWSLLKSKVNKYVVNGEIVEQAKQPT